MSTRPLWACFLVWGAGRRSTPYPPLTHQELLGGFSVARARVSTEAGGIPSIHSATWKGWPVLGAGIWPQPTEVWFLPAPRLRPS